MARPVDTPELARKREREAQMVSQMIALWCRGHHGGGHVVEQAGDDESVRVKLGLRTITLCPECAELQKYAIARIEHCPHIGTKTFCSACPSHCYRPAMREKIREVMRWSVGLAASRYFTDSEAPLLMIAFFSVGLIFLSGVSYPLELMPWYWRMAHYILPAAPATLAFVKLNSMGADMADIQPEYITLWIQVIVYFGLSVWVYKKKLEA